jgi:hypothetical protein
VTLTSLPGWIATPRIRADNIDDSGNGVAVADAVRDVVKQEQCLVCIERPPATARIRRVVEGNLDLPVRTQAGT